ncbi:unnamed protein product [Miscanthus lutarioriparius]|uniref:Uncharacterized protein n=1 Tax=Miscanthus lutarioriparius TaxID=422564 RepID=A0A811SKV9_9POAL|nr:unnamed protein product [Miscanthus lutarioriparius]
MAGATNGGGGGGKVISMPLQYFCVLAAAVVAVMVLSLSFMSPAAMVAVRHNLGSSVAAAAPGSSNSSGGAAAGLAAASPPPVAREEKEQARRRPPVVLFNFGDSNSDTGGVAAAGGMRIMPPEGRTYFHHPTGRLSDGRVIIDFICESLGTHELNPYLKGIGSDYSNGVNFAMAGSHSDHGFSDYSLNVQVDQFVYFRHRSLRMFERGLKGPVSKEGFENALYMMDIGHNDMILYDNGARKFWVHGTSASWGACWRWWCREQGREGQARLPRRRQQGCHRRTTRSSASSVTTSGSTSRAPPSSYTDMFAIKIRLRRQPHQIRACLRSSSSPGIEWPFMVCCGNGGPPYNMEQGKPGCGDLCPPEAKVVSWDSVHFTDFGSGLAAKLTMSGEYCPG